MAANKEILNHSYSAMPVGHGLLDGLRYLAETKFEKLKEDLCAFAKTFAVLWSTSIQQKTLAGL